MVIKLQCWYSGYLKVSRLTWVSPLSCLSHKTNNNDHYEFSCKRRSLFSIIKKPHELPLVGSQLASHCHCHMLSCVMLNHVGSPRQLIKCEQIWRTKKKQSAAYKKNKHNICGRACGTSCISFVWYMVLPNICYSFIKSELY